MERGEQGKEKTRGNGKREKEKREKGIKGRRGNKEKEQDRKREKRKRRRKRGKEGKERKREKDGGKIRREVKRAGLGSRSRLTNPGAIAGTALKKNKEPEPPKIYRLHGPSF